MLSSRLAQSAALLAAAIALIGTFEGLRTKAYRDPVGIPTICFGETRGVHMGDVKTVEQCKEMLGDALLEFEQGMLRCLKNPAAIPDKSYTAFLSLAYNIGNGAFCKSSIARALNAGDLRTACNNILRFNKAGGRVLQGLVKRRKQERALCLQGLADKEAWK